MPAGGGNLTPSGRPGDEDQWRAAQQRAGEAADGADRERSDEDGSLLAEERPADLVGAQREDGLHMTSASRYRARSVSVNANPAATAASNWKPKKACIEALARSCVPVSLRPGDNTASAGALNRSSN